MYLEIFEWYGTVLRIHFLLIGNCSLQTQRYHKQNWHKSGKNPQSILIYWIIMFLCCNTTSYRPCVINGVELFQLINFTQECIYSRAPNNRPPPRLLIFRFFTTHDTFIPTPPALLIFSHFCSHFWVWIAIFIIVHHKEKEIVLSSTITMNYVNTKHMLSLWDPIVGMSIVCNENDYKIFWTHLCN